MITYHSRSMDRIQWPLDLRKRVFACFGPELAAAVKSTPLFDAGVSRSMTCNTADPEAPLWFVLMSIEGQKNPYTWAHEVGHVIHHVIDPYWSIRHSDARVAEVVALVVECVLVDRQRVEQLAEFAKDECYRGWAATALRAFDTHKFVMNPNYDERKRNVEFFKSLLAGR